MTSTTASFLSTPASATDSSVPGSARSSHEAPGAESPAFTNGGPSQVQPKPYVPPRQTRHRGPSVLESVISHTRPVYLPPKPKAEDRKHLKDWETMMAHARAAEEKRKQEEEMLAVEREKKRAEALEIWEKQVMPDIAAATKDKKLRKLWWNGVPPKLRGRIWAATVGNPLALSKDSYRPYISRARRAITAGKFPRQTLELIEDDIAGTMPSLRIFDPVHGPLHQDLKDLLCAWTVARSEESLSYVKGASHVAGMFLINMPVDQAFLAFRNLLDRHCMRSFYAGQTASSERLWGYRIFDTLLADIMPKVYYNFQKHHVPPTRYLPDWIVPVFLLHLPFDTCARIWDLVLLEGDSFLFRAALGVMGVMEGRLYFPDHDELMQVLRGDDGTRGKGKARETVAEGGRYAQNGITEESLFDRIEAVDEWWKENTWMRLIQRELPDL
ncbi:RabGAP/TBC [Calocera cornea HHB12733]|uniref:RabGAP/TBC n=1 Tax=Calocera cornea HHB12733 TaxID=1353952 RepID=A0A165EDY0_9BASI|nr:RabGAP/TBC [Calocera cornea HHB12733]